MSGKQERKRNRSKVSPTISGKQSKVKIDSSDTPSMASDKPPSLVMPGSRKLSLGDISTRISVNHKDIKLNDKDTNLIKVIVALIEESLTESTNFIDSGLQDEIAAHKQTQQKLTELGTKHNALEHEHKKLESKVPYMENQLLEMRLIR